jgi:hypothetical protein
LTTKRFLARLLLTRASLNCRAGLMEPSLPRPSLK